MQADDSSKVILVSSPIKTDVLLVCAYPSSQNMGLS